MITTGMEETCRTSTSLTNRPQSVLDGTGHATGWQRTIRNGRLQQKKSRAFPPGQPIKKSNHVEYSTFRPSGRRKRDPIGKTDSEVQPAVYLHRGYPAQGNRFGFRIRKENQRNHLPRAFGFGRAHHADHPQDHCGKPACERDTFRWLPPQPLASQTVGGSDGGTANAFHRRAFLGSTQGRIDSASD